MAAVLACAHARDAIHTRAGYRTLRFTDHHVITEPEAVAQTVAAALSDTSTYPTASATIPAKIATAAANRRRGCPSSSTVIPATAPTRMLSSRAGAT